MEIDSKIKDINSTPIMKRQMGRIQPLPRALATLVKGFTKIVVPFHVNFDILWGIVYIDLKASSHAPVLITEY